MKTCVLCLKPFKPTQQHKFVCLKCFKQKASTIDLNAKLKASIKKESKGANVPNQS